jgi:anti-anti-sigma regulatory factor/HAMP domain-containing protein
MTIGSQPPAQSLRWRLATKIILSVAGLLIAVAIAVSTLTFIQVRQSAFSELESKGLAIAQTLNYTFEVLLGQDALTNLQRLTEDSATLPSVEKIQVAARDQSILASSDPAEANQTVSSPQLRAFLEQADWQTKTYLTEDGELVIIQPLRGKTFLGGMNNNTNIIGAVQVNLNRRNAEAAARNAALRLLAISLTGYLLIFIVLALVLRALVVRPVTALADNAQRFRAGERSIRSAVHSTDEVGLLAGTFNAMAEEVEDLLTSLEDQVATRTSDLEQERATLAGALSDLRASTSERLMLAETLRELSTPVIKLYHQIILLPLIGTIDAARAEQIQRALLAGITSHNARKVILDLTGVPVIDEQVAQALTRLPRAAQLLGTQVIIVGISPEVAQSIVHQGIDMGLITTFADLQSGVQYALSSLGLIIASSRSRPA